ncbi:50S ribosomal protein L25 [Thermotoga maritima MSB8]|uniref:Large ribosomal subunit protein bL25 n=1 Tax=Thermotoga maritima (strain ATCC 43589 / DSM 3109 / JCM 10099 / NBRC 100826 / MSB8) TaxID=243274 RepID=RL25_THEMA|nr:50S ribosomal protein L25 [Thermotoga maritima]Q9X1W2.1 RecName: Full=Large ribosomal subunit protein bL25; AltName: Full=50S ribosomal protein L25; AltName: Full=General stress protein CTC [Thermotoga maritima MSB8]AAD36694.1 general stress protein Ctc [Thermotoga maritima MSB8]AGL50560.1 LSU ribosomal protein L25p [Thermotoga maritima MSB8]AHD18476.1 50S ribosomal protein L25 [Thermotoga maritima MSB8]AKE27513.1 50S ribosomal protein L25 [Thermotoga maritima]AKE29386.1 50S ribosomal prot
MVSLEARVREVKGKREARRLRRRGEVPAVVYGPATEPIPVKIKRSVLEKIFHTISEATPIQLIIKDDQGNTVAEKTVFLKMVQRDKVSETVVHLDFYEPTKGHRMRINVPLKVVGKPVGVEKGGFLEVFHEEIPVETDPDKVPQEIEVDVSSLDLGDVIHARDLKLPEGVKCLLEEEEAVVSVLVPKEVAIEEATEEEEEAAEPEVIKRKEEEEE